MKQIVIAGGGFAGLRLARKLSKTKDVAVTLINSSPDFRYSPALYRAATGFKMGTARVPLEWALLDSSNVRLIVDTVIHLDKENRLITLESGMKLPYDYAVFALGAVTTYFGIQGLDNHSYGIKTPEEVQALQRHIHEKLTNKDAAEQNYVIVGAGPTGVELSGAIGSYIKKVSKKHSIKNAHVSVYLVEAGPRILPQMNERAGKKAHKQLEKLDIKILCNTVVSAETSQSLHTSQGSIKTHNVIWTAGTANNPFFKNHPDIFTLDKRGKVVVDEHLQATSHVYVCGDNASTRYSGLAITAVSHGSFIAQDIVARMHNRNRPGKFEKTPVQVVPAGPKWSIMQYKNLAIGGRPIGLLRKVADLVGYIEVLGILKALTIWTNTEKTEENCSMCHK